MENKPKLFLSFGGGVQTSALLLAYDRGLLKEKPEAAIFADTQAETDRIYSWIKKLKTKVSIPIITETRGSLIDYTFKYGYSQAPVYGVKEDGGKFKSVMGRRSCTYLFKISMVNRGVRRFTKTVRKRLGDKYFRVALGISMDEQGRMHGSREKWIRNTFPLVEELQWNRKQCSDYVLGAIGETPPRSACYMCPYLRNDEWKDLRDNQPEFWKKAVEYDEKIRDLRKGFKNYLHRDKVPLKEAHIDNDKYQSDFFQQSCFGDCGL